MIGKKASNLPNAHLNFCQRFRLDQGALRRLRRRLCRVDRGKRGLGSWPRTRGTGGRVLERMLLQLLQLFRFYFRILMQSLMQFPLLLRFRRGKSRGTRRSLRFGRRINSATQLPRAELVSVARRSVIGVARPVAALLPISSGHGRRYGFRVGLVLARTQPRLRIEFLTS